MNNEIDVANLPLLPEQTEAQKLHKSLAERYQEEMKEELFAVAFIENNYDVIKAAKAIGYTDDNAVEGANKYLFRPRVKHRIDRIHECRMVASSIRYETKIAELDQVITQAKEGATNKDGTYDGSLIINAIKTLNDMQGHKAAEKAVTINANADTNGDEMADLLAKYARNY